MLDLNLDRRRRAWGLQGGERARPASLICPQRIGPRKLPRDLDRLSTIDSLFRCRTGGIAPGPAQLDPPPFTEHRVACTSVRCRRDDSSIICGNPVLARHNATPHLPTVNGYCDRDLRLARLIGHYCLLLPSRSLTCCCTASCVAP